MKRENLTTFKITDKTEDIRAIMKKKRFHDSKSICHLQIHRTDIKRGINHNNSAK